MYQLIILTLSGLLIATPTAAKVFKCVSVDGAVYYQDKYCNDEDDIQTELSCFRREQRESNRNASSSLQSQQRQLERRRQQKLAKRKLTEKRMAAQQKRRQRLEEKCNQVKYKIERVAERYRRGYTALQAQTLERKMAEYQREKLKVCVEN